MISDVLSDAADKIEDYLAEFPSVYEGWLLHSILGVLDHMHAVRRLPGMDSPPLGTGAEHENY
jgi:hypothetical protein